MNLNGYTAKIQGGDEKADGYVYMRQSQSYAVILRNRKSTRCDAKISIDGKDIGTWRLEPYATATIQRPAKEDGQLTFYKTASVEGRLTDDGISRENEGLVRVSFTPERDEIEKVMLTRETSDSCDMFRGNMESGHTGLAERTNQEFEGAPKMYLNNEKTVTINLRLVAERIVVPVVPQQLATIPKPPGPPYGSMYIRPEHIQQTIIPRPV